MGLTREEQELILKVTGAGDVQRLVQEIKKEEAALRGAVAAHEAHEAEVGVSTAATAAYEAELKRSVAVLAEKTQALGKARVAAADYRQNLTGLSYALNDFLSVNGGIQQRLNAIANNLPMLLAGFGGVGLALSAIVPIVAALLPHLDKLGKALGFEEPIQAGLTGIERLKAKLKELEEKPTKLAVDIRGIQEGRQALEKLQRDVEAYNTLVESRRTRERASADANAKVLAEAGGAEVGGALKAAAAKRLEASDPETLDARRKIAELEGKLRRLEESGPVPGDETGGETREFFRGQFQKDIAKERDRIEQRRLAISDPGNGDAARAVGNAVGAVQRGDPGPLAGQLEGIGRNDLAEQLRKNSPKALALEEARRKAKAIWDKVAEDDAEVAAKRQKAILDRNEDLYQQGQRYEQLGKDEAAKAEDARRADIKKWMGIQEVPPDPADVQRQAIERAKQRVAFGEAQPDIDAQAGPPPRPGVRRRRRPNALIEPTRQPSNRRQPPGVREAIDEETRAEQARRDANERRTAEVIRRGEEARAARAAATQEKVDEAVRADDARREANDERNAKAVGRPNPLAPQPAGFRSVPVAGPAGGGGVAAPVPVIDPALGPAIAEYHNALMQLAGQQLATTKHLTTLFGALHGQVQKVATIVREQAGFMTTTSYSCLEW